MIVVDLVCEHEHRFEGWFAHSEDIESQQQRGLLRCAICGSRNMRRLPSAPHVHSATSAQENTDGADATSTPSVSSNVSNNVSQNALQNDSQHLLQLLVKKLQESASSAEDVGEDFPVEVRRIHFGDAEERAIRGLATAQDVASLLDEGISVLPVPPKEDLH